MVDVTKYISKDAHFVLERVSGSITEPELARKMKDLFDDPNYRSDMCGICDLRGARPALTRAEMDRFSRDIAARTDFGSTRWAIVTDHPILNAYGHILQRRVGEDALIRVFTTIEAAEEYIGANTSDVLAESRPVH